MTPIVNTRPEMTALRSCHRAQSQMASFIIVTPGEFCTMAKEVRQSHMRIGTVPLPVAEPPHDRRRGVVIMPNTHVCGKSSGNRLFSTKKEKNQKKEIEGRPDGPMENAMKPAFPTAPQGRRRERQRM